MKWIEDIKKNSRYLDYDCIIGLSGGVDSCYLAHCAVNIWGLRVYAYSFDNGWNDQIANHNIKVMTDKLGINCSFQYFDVTPYNRAMVLSGMTDVDIPSDLALLRGTFDCMYDNDIKYYLSGANPHTEKPIPLDWSLIDDTYMMDVVGKYGKNIDTSIPRLTAEFYLQHIKDHTEIRPFGLVDLPPDDVIKDFLTKEYDWKEYGGKHCDNVYTRWTIYKYLPLKFGIEKWNYYHGYNKYKLDDTEEVLSRLGISKREYDSLVLAKRKFRTGYKNNLKFWKEHRNELKGKVPDSFWIKYCQ